MTRDSQSECKPESSPSTSPSRIHRDPFDRLLIAQARTEGMILATSDSQIRQYEVSTIW